MWTAPIALPAGVAWVCFPRTSSFTIDATSDPLAEQMELCKMNQPTRLPLSPTSTVVRALLCTAGVCAALTLAGCKGSGRSSSNNSESAATGAVDIAGRYIVAVCDTDMNESTLMTRELGPINPLSRDALTIIPLPIEGKTTPFSMSHVSNSALGPPRCLAVSPNGSTLYAVEMRGEAPENARTLDDLPPGQYLTVVDARNPLAAEVVQHLYVGTEPSSVAVNTRGDLLAITTNTPGQQLVIARLINGRVEVNTDQSPKILAWPLFGLDGAEDLRPSSVEWLPEAGNSNNPGGGTLAVTIPERNQVMFYRITLGADEELTLAPWDNPVQVGKYPYSGVFTPDGKYFIVSNMGWGQDIAGFTVGAAPGVVSVVRVGSGERKEGQTLITGSPHEVVSSATVGVSPEGLAISPNGRLIVTANLRHSNDGASLDEGSLRGGSLSLLTLDANGQLKLIDEYPINAVPAGVTFDASGEKVGVTQFRSFDTAAIDGEISFWGVERARSSTPRLENLKYYVGLGKGPHAVQIVR